MGNNLANEDTGHQGDTNMGFALPAGQVKAILLALRVSSTEAEPKVEESLHRAEEGGGFPEQQQGHVLEPAWGLPLEHSQLLLKAAMSTHSQRSLSKQRDFQYCTRLYAGAAEKTSQKCGFTSPAASSPINGKGTSGDGLGGHNTSAKSLSQHPSAALSQDDLVMWAGLAE